MAYDQRGDHGDKGFGAGGGHDGPPRARGRRKFALFILDLNTRGFSAPSGTSWWGARVRGPASIDQPPNKAVMLLFYLGILVSHQKEIRFPLLSSTSPNHEGIRLVEVLPHASRFLSVIEDKLTNPKVR